MAWKRSETDKRRVILVDFSHLAFSFAYGGATALSGTLNINGVSTVVDTTIPAYTIKVLHRWANGGANPIAVCFDGKGCTKSRSMYFAQLKGTKVNEENGDIRAIAYKGSREPNNGKFYDGINLTTNFLHQGGVPCYKADSYEADDLIMACLAKAKVDYPDIPIDIFTGDTDLLPLVDEQVSVFIRSRKMTWAESKDLERPHYVQIRPYNYQSYVESLTNFKGLPVPYNSVLLTKLLRGDKADEIPGKPDWKPKIYRQLLDILVADGYDLGELFRYGANTETIVWKDTQEPVPTEMLSTELGLKHPDLAGKIAMHYGDPVELTNLCDVLKNYVEPEDIEHVRAIYNGINLNCAYTGLPDGFNRKPAQITSPIKGYDMVRLASEVSVLKINLPIF